MKNFKLHFFRFKIHIEYFLIRYQGKKIKKTIS